MPRNLVVAVLLVGLGVAHGSVCGRGAEALSAGI
jgi:hypothetical protein